VETDDEEERAVNRLVAIAYPDLRTAERVREEVVRAADEGLAELDDAVVVERTRDGVVKLHQVRSAAKSGAGKGALAGAAIGMLFLAPLLGAAIGAAGGGLGGKLSDDGVDDVFLEELGGHLRPGAAALIVLGSTEARDALIDRVSPYGGVVVQSNLAPEVEQRLREALGARAATAPEGGV
jgi:uncharacterized membrane protein